MLLLQGKETRAPFHRGSTLGADKGCDVREFVQALQRRGIRARIARNTTNGRRRCKRIVCADSNDDAVRANG